MTEHEIEQLAEQSRSGADGALNLGWKRETRFELATLSLGS